MILVIQNEFELISCEKIKHIKIFLDDVTYRNYHFHSSYELIYILDGTGQINLPGESIHVVPGSLIMLNQNETHEIDAFGGHLVGAFIQVSRHFCEEYLPNLSLVRFLHRDIASALAKEPERLCALKREVCEIAMAYLKEEPYFEFDCLVRMVNLFRSLMESVLHEFLSGHDRSTIRKHVQRMNRIVGYVENNYMSPIRLKELAELEGVSTTYISHFFSEQFGITFQEYLNNLRFERAISLLQDETISAGEAALASGFSDLKYLNKMMRQRMGCSTKDYRSGVVQAATQAPAKHHFRLLERFLTPEEALARLELENTPYSIEG